MKSLSILALGAMLCTSAFAAEIEAGYLNASCKISGNKITRTMKFGKENPVTASESYTMNFTGLDAAVNAAVATSTGRPAEGAEQSFIVITDGKRTELNGSDSKEAMHVIRLIVKVCKLNT